MPNTTEDILKDASDIPASGFFDPVSHELVAAEVVSVTRDSVTGKLYGILNTNATFYATSIALNDANATSHTVTIDSSGNLHTLDANSAAAKSDLDTLAGVVSSNKAAVKSATSDIADLATLLTLAGTSGDANTVSSLMGRLTKIRDLLNTTLNTASSQTGTWTIQPGNTQNTTPWLVNSPSSDIAVFASGAHTVTQTQVNQTNNTARGIKVVLDMTDVTSGPSVTLEINGYDVASGKSYTILSGAAVTTVSTNVYTIYPGLAAVTNSVADDVLPHTWQITVTANNANSGSYSVGASLIP